MTEDFTYRVNKLKNGIVIDHLRQGSAFDALKVMKLTSDDLLSIGMNYDSKKHTKKDIIKIENRSLKQEEIHKLALISPEATYCIIKDFKVIEKKQVILPDILENIVKCNNPRCITNHEDIHTRFQVLIKKPVILKCYYCERRMDKMEIDIK